MILLLEILMAIAIVSAIIFIIVVSLRSHRSSSLDPEYFKEEWASILKAVGTGEQGWRLAIIDADKLLDQALRQLGVRGENLGERLKNSESRFSKYNNLWSAHKLRNRLVHEPNVKLSKQLTSRALKEFQLALKELGALQ